MAKTSLTQEQLDYYGYGGEGFTADIDFYSDSSFTADKLKIVDNYRSGKISADEMIGQIGALEMKYTTDNVMGMTLPSILVEEEYDEATKSAIAELKTKKDLEIDTMFNEVIWPKMAANMDDMSFNEARDYLNIENYGDLPVREIIAMRPNLADSVATYMIDKIAPKGLLDTSENWSNADIIKIAERNNANMKNYKRKVFNLLEEFDSLPEIEYWDDTSESYKNKSSYGFDFFNKNMSIDEVQTLFNVHNMENTIWIAKAKKDRDAALQKWLTAEDAFVGRDDTFGTGEFGPLGIGGEGKGAVWNPLVAVVMEGLFGWTYDWWGPDHEEVWHNYRILWDEKNQRFGSPELDRLLDDLAWHQENVEAGPPKDYTKFEDAKESLDKLASEIKFDTSIVEQSGYDELLEYVTPEHLKETFK